ncbi:MAG: ROK family transcriptional regulator [Bacillota bacterium]
MATSTYLRQMHLRRIIETVARTGSMSRSDLARATGMSQPTVGRIVDQLLQEHLLVESAGENVSTEGVLAKGTPVIGRPSTRLELDRCRPRFGVVQLGVRHTRLAVLPVAIPSEDHWQHEFPTPSSADAWVRQLAKVWQPYCAQGLKTVIGLPGVVDDRTGKVYLSPNLRWLEKADLASALRDVFGVNLMFKQEIRLLALGHVAAEPDSGDFLLIDSGNGVGAAAVAHGTLYDGPLPLSGELGHIHVLGNKRRCGCGATGCLETLISRPGLLVSAAEHGLPKSWPALLEHLAARPFPQWMKHTLDSTAVAIASALNLLGLRQVVLTGAFAELPTSCVEYLSRSVQEHAMWARFGDLSIRPAPRRRQAGMVSLALDSMLVADA